MRPIPTWLRALFLINVLLLAPQVIGLFLPSHIPFPVTVSPLNARFIAVLYLASAIGMVLSAFGEDVADIRIFLFAFGVISLLVLAVTLIYWSEFAARRVPAIWLLTYLVDPVAVAAALLALRPLSAAEPGRHGLTPLFLIEAAVLGIAGIALVASPSVALQLWPWKINAILSQVYGAFLLAFALGAGLCAFEGRHRAVFPVVASTTALAALTLIVTRVHIDRFAHGAVTEIWLAGFFVVLIAFGAVLLSFARPAVSAGPGLRKAQ